MRTWQYFKTRIWILFVPVIVLAFATAQAKTLPEMAKLVPPETIVLVDIANFSECKTQFEKTDLHKLYKDPAMAAFAEQIKGKWKEMVNELDENNILRSLIDADILPQGRVSLAIAFSRPQKDKEEPPVLLMTEWGQEDIAKVKEAVTRMMEKNAELGGRKKSSEQFQDVTIETAVDEKGTEFSYCFIDNYFMGTTNAELLKFAVAHAKGASSPALAADTDYQNTIKATGPYHDVDFYLNIRQLIKIAVSEDTTGQAQNTMSALGVDSVSGLGLSLGVARTPANQWLGKALLRNNGAKKGILKMLDAKSSALDVPKFVPASVYRVSLVNLDLKTMYSELANVLNAVNPMFASLLYMPLIPPSPQGEPPLQLKEDIIDHLGSQIVVAQGVKKPFSMEMAPTEYAVAVATSNRSALEKSLATLHSKRFAVGNPDAKRELLGHTLYLINLQAMPFFNRGPVQPMQATGPGSAEMAIPNLAFTVTDTHVIFGLESSVEQAIRALRSGDSVSSAKWFTAAKAAAPSTALMAGFEDNRAAAEYLWWMLKQIGDTRNLKPDPSMGPAAMFAGAGLNFSVLPEFEAVRKYFGISASHMVSREDGFFIEFKAVESPDK